MPDPTSLEHLYDPEVFRTEGHKLVDALADSLKQSLAAEGPARPFQDPDAAVAEWAKVFNSGSSQSEDLFARWIEKAIKSHHPHTMGHQVGVTAPTSALADLLGSLLDTGNGVFEVGNPATAIERVIVKDLARRMNLGSSAGGYLTSGGTLGSLTAMLAERPAWP